MSGETPTNPRGAPPDRQPAGESTLQPASSDASPHAPTRIGASLPHCLRCGYDLSGLDLGGKCPECELLIEETVWRVSESGLTLELAAHLSRAVFVRRVVLVSWAFGVPALLFVESYETRNSRPWLSMIGAGVLLAVSTATSVRIWTLERGAPLIGNRARRYAVFAVLPLILVAAAALVSEFVTHPPRPLVVALVAAIVLSLIINTSLLNALLRTRAVWRLPERVVDLSVSERAGGSFIVLVVISCLAAAAPVFWVLVAVVAWVGSFGAVSQFQRAVGRWRQEIRRSAGKV